MDNSDVEATLEAAERTFRETRGQTPERGLDTADAPLIQLRKACRLLEAARSLRRRNGYYTVVIEASFVAIERSIQAFLVSRGYTTPDELRIGHTAVFDRASQVNLCSGKLATRLAHLWEQNRAELYYRETVASDQQATAMLALGEAIHQHVLAFGSLEHQCLCDRES